MKLDILVPASYIARLASVCVSCVICIYLCFICIYLCVSRFICIVPCVAPFKLVPLSMRDACDFHSDL